MNNTWFRFITLRYISTSPKRKFRNNTDVTDYLTQLNSTQLTTPKEKSGLQEERSYKSLYKSPILQ